MPVADRGQRHAQERLPARGAERRGGLLLLVADLAQDGFDLAHDERQADEDRREHHARDREDDLDAVVGEPAAEPAVAPVDEHEREADDDRRDRERQVDDRLAARALPRNRPRTSASAVMTPRTVLSGTAMSAISTVSQNAWIAAGVVIESHTKPDAVLERPVEDDGRPARAAAPRGTRARGRAGRSGRGGQRPSAAPSGREAAEATDREQHDERQHEQHDRHGGAPR